MSEPLPDEFAAALAASADRRGAFGQRIVFQSSVRSTNDVAQALAEAGAPEGMVVFALAQTAGRGRQGREWFSPPGAGIYMSLIVRSRVVAPMLTLAGGVAVAEGIRRASGLPVLIKWPNDIVVEDERAPSRRRKLAGLLAEGSTGHGGLQHVVLGIGINVRPADYPAALAARVTSLEHELGRAVDAGLVVSETLVALNEQASALEAGHGERMLSRWRALAPAASGRAVSWNDQGVTRRGVTAGIDQHGALLIRVGDDVRRVISGEVMWD
jgi:BirA family biotin operon repressor/biotin-[acetyl-CoA-carboxylase] ligase